MQAEDFVMDEQFHKGEMISGRDYNVILNTKHFHLVPMLSQRDFLPLLSICTKEGFSYPYIHFNQKTCHLPLKERVLNYAKLGDSAAGGQLGRTLIQSIYQFEKNELLGAAILIAVEPGSNLFIKADSLTEWEIGYFVDRDHWGEHVATEAIYSLIKFGIDNWGLKGLWASVEPKRGTSESILQQLGLELVEKIPPGSDRVPYLNEDNEPAARHIYHTPDGWSLPDIKF